MSCPRAIRRATRLASPSSAERCFERRRGSIECRRPWPVSDRRCRLAGSSSSSPPSPSECVTQGRRARSERGSAKDTRSHYNTTLRRSPSQIGNIGNGHSRAQRHHMFTSSPWGIGLGRGIIPVVCRGDRSDRPRSLAPIRLRTALDVRSLGFRRRLEAPPVRRLPPRTRIRRRRHLPTSPLSGPRSASTSFTTPDVA
jgi:hypothetical protein